MRYILFNNNPGEFTGGQFDELEDAKAYAEEEAESDSDFIIYQASPVTQGVTQSKRAWTCLIGKALK